MLIDWFTVGAQALNFLILVWLMERFLYKPILHAIDEREKRIASELADAAATKADAQQERETLRQNNADFEATRAELLNKAKDEARAAHQRLIEQAHQEANILSAKRVETLRQQADNLKQTIGQRAQHEVFAITRKTLMDLAEVSLEDCMCDVFIRRLREMDELAKQRLADSVEATSGPVVVRSAFDLPASLREKLQHALNELLSAKVELRFEADPEVVAGVELLMNGHKVAWSIAEYLRALEKGVGELLHEPDAKVEPKRASGPPSGNTDSNHEPVASARAAST